MSNELKILAASMCLSVISSCKGRGWHAEVSSKSSLSEALLQSGFSFDLNPDKSDQFKSFKADFSKMKLVGLGEATHGTSEFSTARHGLFRYLVEKHGYRVFIIEDEWLGGLYVSEALDNGTDVKQSLNNLTKKGTFLSQETLAMFIWMQNFNKAQVNDPIVVYGADAQNWTTLISSLNYLGKNVPNYLQETSRMSTIISDFVKDASSPKFLNTADIQTFKKPLQSARQFENLLLSAIKNTSDKKLRRLEGLVRFPAQFVQKVSLDYMGMLAQTKGPGFLEKVKSDKEFVALFDSQCLQSTYVCRDYSMATNIKIALEIEQRRGVYWAHNGHVARFLNHPEIIWPNPKPRTVQTVPNTGAFLSETYNVEYFPIVTDFYSGSFMARVPGSASLKSWKVDGSPVSPGSLHQSIHESGRKNFVLNFREQMNQTLQEILQKPQLIRTIGAEFGGNNTIEQSYMSAILPKYADAYMFFDVTSAHRELP